MDSTDYLYEDDSGSYESEECSMNAWLGGHSGHAVVGSFSNPAAIYQVTRRAIRSNSHLLKNSVGPSAIGYIETYETPEGGCVGMEKFLSSKGKCYQPSSHDKKMQIIKQVMLKNWGPDEWKLVNSLDQL